MGNSFYTGTDAELYAGSQAFSTKITATPTAYGLVAAQATAYAALDSLYAAAYVAATDPESRTKGKIAAKNAARADLKAMASDLAKIIDATPTVTDEQKIDLGLSVRDHQPTPIPPPAFAPAILVESVNGNTVQLRLKDSQNPDRRGKPEGVIGASVFSFAGDVAPSQESEWNFEGSTGKTKVLVEFPSSVEPGSKVWFTAYWFNGRKQSGPAAAAVGTRVQGGQAMSQAA